VLRFNRWRPRIIDRLGLLSKEQVARAVWLGVVIGLLAGLAAIAFAEAIEFATENLLGRLAGYHPPLPLGEGSVVGAGPERRWALPLVLGLGGLVVGILVYWLAPETEGPGADAAIYSYHHESGRIRARVIPVKLVASAITIGSGGAAGREGPTSQIGAGVGSLVADRFKLSPAERRRAMAAGMGAGIGAIFRAPLGGAMMAAEVLYRHDFEADVILMALISSIVGFSVYGAWTSYDPIFGGGAGFAFSRPEELPYYAALGVICGLMGILYARSFHRMTDVFRRVALPRWSKPMIGGLLAGSIGAAFPESIHVGYGFVQQSLTIDGVMAFSPWLLLFLPLLRIVTTSLSVGSGGAGGIFGPGMVIGGLTGAAVWRLFNDLPGFPAEPGPVVIIGMIAMFGAVAHAPLAMLLMVGEMTGNLSLLAPAMVAVAVATLLVGDTSIYRSQLANQADSPAHRDRFAFPLLGALPAERAAVLPVLLIEEDQSLEEALRVVEMAGSPRAIVVRKGGDILGEVRRDDLRAAAEASPGARVASLASPFPVLVRADQMLDEVLDLLTTHERRWLPVIDGDGGRVLGGIDTRTVLSSYREAADSHVRPLTPVAEALRTFEFHITRTSPVEGSTLAEVALPEGVRVLTIARRGVVMVPIGSTRLLAEDVVTVAVPDGKQAAVMNLLLGTGRQD
jgi:chloride channel protein, CIC family